MRAIKNSIILLLFSFLLSSCSSILNLSTKTIQVYSQQDSTYVTYNNTQYECPAEIVVKRSYKHDSIIVTRNNRTDTVKLFSVVSPTFAYNYMTYGLGYLVDFTNKRMMTFDAPIYIDYSKKDLISTWRNPRSGSTFFNVQLGIFDVNSNSFISTLNPEFELQYFINPNNGIYGRIGASMMNFENLFTNTLEFGFHTTLRRQLNLKFGAFMYSASPYFDSYLSENRKPTETFAGISVSTRRYIHKGFYSFLKGYGGVNTDLNDNLFGFEFGYGISINKDFLSVIKK